MEEEFTLEGTRSVLRRMACEVDAAESLQVPEAFFNGDVAPFHLRRPHSDSHRLGINCLDFSRCSRNGSSSGCVGLGGEE